MIVKDDYIIATEREKATLSIVCMLFTLAIASQNGLLGWSKTAIVLFVVISVSLFVMSDVAMSTLSSSAFRYRRSLVKGIVAGLFLISMYAGASFWLMLQHQSDLKHSKADSYKSDASAINTAIKSTAGVYTDTQNSRAREGMQQALTSLVKIRQLEAKDSAKFGTDIDSSNALAWYIARYLDVSYALVVFSVNILFNTIMILTVVGLSVVRANTYTLSEYAKRLELEKEIEELERRPVTLRAQFKNLEVDKAKRLILDEKVKPSIKQLQAKGVDKNNAQTALKQLKQDGKISKVGNSNYYNLVG